MSDDRPIEGSPGASSSGPSGPPVDPTTTAVDELGELNTAGGVGAVEPRSGLPTEAKLFGSIGACYLALGLIYGATSHEAAGTVLLLLGAAFAFTVAGYSWFSLRNVQRDTEILEGQHPEGPPDHGDLYLPHTSIWPLGVAVGTAMTLSGIAIGWWIILPGAALLVHSIIGFAAQSRDRT